MHLCLFIQKLHALRGDLHRHSQVERFEGRPEYVAAYFNRQHGVNREYQNTLLFVAGGQQVRDKVLDELVFL